MRRNYVGLVLGACLFTTLLAATPARSAMVTSCDETSLRAAIAQGGTVTFACDGVINLASELVLAGLNVNLVIDGKGHQITLDGGNGTRLLKVGRSGNTIYRQTSVKSLSDFFQRRSGIVE